MKYLIFIIFICIYPTCIFSQNTMAFSLDRWISNYDLNLYLFSDGTYYLDGNQQITDDMINTFILSYGSFTNHENFITLHDEVFSYEVKAIIRESKLTFTEAPVFIKDQILTYDQALNSVEKDLVCIGIDSTISEYEINLKLKIIVDINTCIAHLKPGRYIDNNQCELHLKSNGEYEYLFASVLISFGNWKVLC